MEHSKKRECGFNAIFGVLYNSHHVGIYINSYITIFI